MITSREGPINLFETDRLQSPLYRPCNLVKTGLVDFAIIGLTEIV